MNPVIRALRFRHACKSFNPDKKIPREKIDMILSAAHLSPSSFGLEPWRFVVFETDSAKQSLRPACWDQPQITDCSDLVVILTRPSLVLPDSDYVKQKFARRQLPADATEAYIARYRRHMQTEVEPRMSYYAWGSKQCYIALGNMMTAAAAAGIDSCPIEGFDKQPVEEVLELNTDQYQVAVILALGFRAREQTQRLRDAFEEIVEFR